MTRQRPASLLAAAVGLLAGALPAVAQEFAARPLKAAAAQGVKEAGIEPQ